MSVGDWSSDVCSSDLVQGSSTTAYRLLDALRAVPAFSGVAAFSAAKATIGRSEERRVGREGRCRWVTGVQTCALPIWSRGAPRQRTGCSTRSVLFLRSLASPHSPRQRRLSVDRKSVVWGERGDVGG